MWLSVDWCVDQHRQEAPSLAGLSSANQIAAAKGAERVTQEASVVIDQLASSARSAGFDLSLAQPGLRLKG